MALALNDGAGLLAEIHKALGISTRPTTTADTQQLPRWLSDQQQQRIEARDAERVQAAADAREARAAEADAEAAERHAARVAAAGPQTPHAFAASRAAQLRASLMAELAKSATTQEGN